MTDFEKNYGGLEFETLGWTFFKLNNLNEKGKFRLHSGLVEKFKLFPPPIRKPPIDTNKVKPIDFEIDFRIDLVVYDQKMLNKMKAASKKKIAPKTDMYYLLFYFKIY